MPGWRRASLRQRDIDFERREIRAAGTKTLARDRIVRVAEWALPYVEDHSRGLRPNDRLFPGIDRWSTSDAHREACARLGIGDYQIRDQRHSYAVRAARAGTPAELSSKQLGHANAVLVLEVYGLSCRASRRATSGNDRGSTGLGKRKTHRERYRGWYLI